MCVTDRYPWYRVLRPRALPTLAKRALLTSYSKESLENIFIFAFLLSKTSLEPKRFLCYLCKDHRSSKPSH